MLQVLAQFAILPDPGAGNVRRELCEIILIPIDGMLASTNVGAAYPAAAERLSAESPFASAWRRLAKSWLGLMPWRRARWTIDMRHVGSAPGSVEATESAASSLERDMAAASAALGHPDL